MIIESIPTYEQFITEYTEDQAVTESYQFENEAWDSIKSYGPGVSLSKEKVKEVSSIGLAGLSLVCPPVGVSISTSIAIAGVAMKITGEIINDDKLKELGWDMATVGTGGALGGVKDINGHSGRSCSMPICPKK